MSEKWTLGKMNTFGDGWHPVNTWSDYYSTQGFLEDDIGHPTDIASNDGWLARQAITGFASNFALPKVSVAHTEALYTGASRLMCVSKTLAIGLVPKKWLFCFRFPRRRSPLTLLGTLSRPSNSHKTLLTQQVVTGHVTCRPGLHIVVTDHVTTTS
jgi:hypothetical protein